MNLKLRSAYRTDMVSVLKLIKELALFEKEPEAVEISEQTLIEDGFGTKPLFHVFVAELDKTIVGMALFYERYSTWKGKSLHLEDLIVQEKFRGKGIGHALYTKVLKHAYNNGYKRVAWEVLDWNTVAIDYYISTGATVFDDWRVAQINEKNLEKFVKSQK